MLHNVWTVQRRGKRSSRGEEFAVFSEAELHAYHNEPSARYLSSAVAARTSSSVRPCTAARTTRLSTTTCRLSKAESASDLGGRARSQIGIRALAEPPQQLRHHHHATQLGLHTRIHTSREHVNEGGAFARFRRQQRNHSTQEWQVEAPRTDLQSKLQYDEGRALEPKVGLEVLRDLSEQGSEDHAGQGRERCII